MEETKAIKESTMDPESGYHVKGERTKQFAYSFHAAADRNVLYLECRRFKRKADMRWTTLRGLKNCRCKRCLLSLH